MLLLLDIGNTNTHLGLADRGVIRRQKNIPTELWFGKEGDAAIQKFVGKAPLEGGCFCSVVPKATPFCSHFFSRRNLPAVELNAATIRGIGIDYPKPKTIGADRLANAVAVRHHFGAPSVVVDFGTAVTFDVVNAAGNYVGGIIAPGLASMTDYLHEKTALLPRIRIEETEAVIGKSTREAMLVGAVHGYRGLIRGLLQELKGELKTKRLPVVATGGYGELMAAKMPEITAIDPLITLEGLRLVWKAHIGDR